MVSEQGRGASRVTRRELLAGCTAGMAAMLLGGASGCAWAASAAGSSSEKPARDASATASASKSGDTATTPAASEAAAPAFSAGKTGKTSADGTSKGGKGSKGTSLAASGATSAESNKARKFKDIPKEALISVDDLYKLYKDGALKNRTVYVIDIRSHRDYQNQLIEGSRNIPAGRQIDIRMNEIPRDKQVVLVALKNSNRLAETWYTLIANGYDEDLVQVLDGGVKAWADAGYPTLEDQFLGC